MKTRSNLRRRQAAQQQNVEPLTESEKRRRRRRVLFGDTYGGAKGIVSVVSQQDPR